MERFRIMEDSLVVTADSMFNAFIPDTRIDYSERFVHQLVRSLKIPNSYYYPFDSLGKVINLLYSDDRAFRIFNWEIAPSDISKRYYGAIQMPSERLKLYGLDDYSEDVGNKGLEDSVLSNKKWYGCLYYSILSRQAGEQKIYMMFGYNGSSSISNKKVLDPMMITSTGVRFGAPVFNINSPNIPGKTINRFVLEYKKGVRVSMNWDKERNAIVFDKLVSQVNDPRRKYTYVPSGEYDALKWENGIWNYISTFIPVTILQEGQNPDTK